MKLVITIILIHKIFDIVAAADTSNSSGFSQQSSTKIIIGVICALILVFIIGICFCLIKFCRPKKGKIREIPVKVSGSKDVGRKHKNQNRGSTSSISSISKEPLMSSTSDVKLSLTTNPATLSKLQLSGTTTPSRVPPQTPLTPPQPLPSAIPSSTQTTLKGVSDLLGSISQQPTRKSTTEIIMTPEISEEFTSHRSRPHSIAEQRVTPPQSQSSSRFSLPPSTFQPFGQQQSELYNITSSTIESQLEQASTRSRDTSPFSQYRDYEVPQAFETPMEQRLQTQSRGSDISLFSDTQNPQSSQHSIEIPIDDSGETYQETGQRRISMQHYAVPQPPYDEPPTTTTPPERRGRPESTYIGDNPGSTVPGRPLTRSTPGTSPRSRRGRRGGNR
ncbi:hypothetical protein C1645_818674 [Glomus cerebriforme]|uniref:Uncharacterized protein n=1 Tax=Glomus cerebriforme TaxID=658196 RepID=A0A397T730_9GLOM|nr:hypothetical protein C1645_818674 [Glomus cerebriforme]